MHPGAGKSGAGPFDIKTCTFMALLKVMKGRVAAAAGAGGLALLKDRIVDLSR